MMQGLPAALMQRRQSLNLNPPPEHWFIICCNAQREQAASQSLEALGFRTFTPVAAVHRVNRRTHATEIRSRVVFARYLFATVDGGEFDFTRLQSVPGVAGVLRIGERCVPVPHGVVADLMNRERHGAFDMLPRAARLGDYGIAAGDTLRVNSGPMAGFDAVVLNLMPRQRARVLLRVLGVDKVATMPLADLDLHA